MRAGGYSDASEVVRVALRELRAKDDPAETDSQELAQLLLPAVRGPHRPLTEKHFDQLRARASQTCLSVSRLLHRSDYFWADLEKQVDWYREHATAKSPSDSSMRSKRHSTR